MTDTESLQTDFAFKDIFLWMASIIWRRNYKVEKWWYFREISYHIHYCIFKTSFIQVIYSPHLYGVKHSTSGPGNNKGLQITLSQNNINEHCYSNSHYYLYGKTAFAMNDIIGLMRYYFLPDQSLDPEMITSSKTNFADIENDTSYYLETIKLSKGIILLLWTTI